MGLGRSIGSLARPDHVDSVSHLPTKLACDIKGSVEMLKHRRTQHSVSGNFDEALVSAIQSLKGAPSSAGAAPCSDWWIP